MSDNLLRKLAESRMQSLEVKVKKSPYNNGGQIIFKSSVTFSPADFDNGKPIICKVNAESEVSFKPVKEIATVDVFATYKGNGLPDKVLKHELRNYVDIGCVSLVDMRCGDYEYFPRPPKKAKDEPDDKIDCCEACRHGRVGGGISFGVFAGNSYGCGISWPVTKPGNPVSAEFEVEKSILGIIEKYRKLPDGYDEIPKSIAAEITFLQVGPTL